MRWPASPAVAARAAARTSRAAAPGSRALRWAGCARALGRPAAVSSQCPQAASTSTTAIYTTATSTAASSRSASDFRSTATPAITTQGMPTPVTTRRLLRRRAGTSVPRTTPTTRRTCPARPTDLRSTPRLQVRGRNTTKLPRRRCTGHRRITFLRRSNKKSGEKNPGRTRIFFDRLADLDRHEDALLAALHEERHAAFRFRRRRAQLRDALDALAVHRDDDVAALDARACRGARGVLDHQVVIVLTQGEAELAGVVAAPRSRLGARPLLGLELGPGHRDRALRAVAPDVEVRLRSRLHRRDERRQLGRAVDRLAIDREEHVARLDARLVGRAAGLHRGDQRAPGLFEGGKNRAGAGAHAASHARASPP